MGLELFGEEHTFGFETCVCEIGGFWAGFSHFELGFLEVGAFLGLLS